MVKRIVDLALVWATAAAVLVVSQWLWPYLGLVSPIGALMAALVVANLVDGARFAIRRRQAPFPRSDARRSLV